MTDERRHYQRINFDAEVLMDHGEVSWMCHLVDISLKGLLVMFPDDIETEAGQVYGMEFRLGEEAVIHMRVKVKHVEEHLVGLEWSDIDLDSLTHLRRLLELNLSDPEEMHRELADLG
ncbi:MAG: PilZ domain-containing protein [Gammaproteobacteria bacterium]|nr:PilZ domain-containing protein [Gammaproteobacteria bacterium]